MTDKFCVWDRLWPLIKRVSTEDMLTDLKFYIKHDRELYFNGMVGIAASFVFFSGLFIGVGVYLLLRIGDVIAISTALNCVGFAFISSIGFLMVKNYLHIRKDYIELKEMIQK
jgi:hypothetical protein